MPTTKRRASRRQSGSGGRQVTLQIRGAGAAQALGLGGLFGGASISSYGNRRLDTDRLTDPYRQEPWAFAAINLFADAVRMAPPRVYDFDPLVDPDRAKVVEDSPLSILLDRVNSLIDSVDLQDQDATNMELSGESLWALTDKNGNPVRVYGAGLSAPIDLPEEIWPLRGDTVELVPNQKTGMPERWRVPNANGSFRDFDIGATLHLRYRNPAKPFRGLGPIAAVMDQAAQNYLALKYQNALLEGGGDMGGVLAIKGSLSETAYKRLQEQVRERQRAVRPGELLLLDDLPSEATYTQTPVGPKVMSYGDLLEQNRTWIAGVFRVPEALLGKQTENYATFHGHQRILWTLKVLPWLRMRDERITRQFVRRLRDPSLNKLFVRHDVSAIDALRGDIKELAEAASALQRIGVSRNESLRIVGIRAEPVDGGDVALVPVGLVPLSDLVLPEDDEAEGAPPAAPAPAAAEDSEESPTAPSAPGKAAPRATPTSDVLPIDPTNPIPAEGPQDRYASWEARRARVKATEVRLRAREKPMLSKVRALFIRQRKAQLRALSAKAAQGRAPDAPKATPTAAPAPAPTWLRNGQAVALARCRTERDVARWTGLYPSTTARSGLDLDGLMEVAFETRASIPKKELDALIMALQKAWVDEFTTSLFAPLKAAFGAELETAASEVGMTPMTAEAPDAMVILRNKSLMLAEGVNSTTAKAVKRALIKALQEKSTEGTLADQIRAALPECETAVRQVYNSAHARAVTIARTEVGQASGVARDQTFRKAKAEGRIKRHRWLTSGQGPEAEGGTVRESHWELEGKVFEIGKWFGTVNGNELRHAHDPGCRGPTPASELVNCGCEMVPVEDDE